jgi:bZIP transcription factor
MESHDPSNDPSYPTPHQQHADGAGVTYQPVNDGALTSMDGNDGDNDNRKRPFSTMMAVDGDANDNPENYVRKAVGKDGEPLSEKKLRRLEKNRLSARECRRRKREATENMERQINMLEGENLRLRLQLQVCGEEWHKKCLLF